MYLFISSEDCKDLYPANTAVDFTVELPQAVKGTHLSLLHVYYRKNQQQSSKAYTYVLCDLVESSVLAGKEERVLGSFFEKGSLEHPQHLKLISTSFKRIHIKLLTKALESPEDLSSLYLTLKVSQHA